MDVIGLYQHGIQNAVATLGTAVTSRHLSKLLGTQKIFILLLMEMLLEK